MCFYFIKNNTLNYFIMDKQIYDSPVIDVCEVIVEGGFASSTTDYENEGQGW